MIHGPVKNVSPLEPMFEPKIERKTRLFFKKWP